MAKRGEPAACICCPHTKLVVNGKALGTRLSSHTIMGQSGSAGGCSKMTKVGTTKVFIQWKECWLTSVIFKSFRWFSIWYTRWFCSVYSGGSRFCVYSVPTLAREIWEGRGGRGGEGRGGEGAWGGDTRKYSRTCMVTSTRERPPRISDRDFRSNLALRMEPLINDYHSQAIATITF